MNTKEKIEKIIGKRLLLELPTQIHKQVQREAKLKGNSVSSELRSLIVKGLQHERS
jgi:hypothetical protein